MRFTETIPEKPRIETDLEAAKQILAVAESYYVNADKLIYSYGSRTFLSGYDLYDPAFGNRGNIDCSTFVMLVLAGIQYEESPYAKGTVKDLAAKDLFWTENELADFANLPDRYIGIAERIGRPELAGPKGLDLEKAAACGLTGEQLGEEIRKTGVRRRTETIAEYYLKKNACFKDPEERRPGDIVFFWSSGFFTEGGKMFRSEPSITHVGIVCEDIRQMIHSSGYLDKARSMQEGTPAIQKSPLFGKREIAFFGRCVGGCVNGDVAD